MLARPTPSAGTGGAVVFGIGASALALLLLALAERRWRDQLATMRAELRPYAVKLLSAGIEGSIRAGRPSYNEAFLICRRYAEEGRLDEHLGSVPALDLIARPSPALIWLELADWLEPLPVEWPPSVRDVFRQIQRESDGWKMVAPG